MLTFDGIKGQDLIIMQLRQAVSEGQASHAYLFTGPEGVGKETTAKALVAALNCLHPVEGSACGLCSSCKKVAGENHPDLYRVFPQGNSIKIGQIRELQQALSYKHWEGRFKVIILHEVERMTDEAANSLLKILEEPPVNTIFILLTTNIYGVLPTILSRCQKLKFNNLPLGIIAGILKDQGVEEEKAELAAHLSSGSLSQARLAIESAEFAEDRRLVKDYCRLLCQGDLWDSLQVAEVLEKNENLTRVLDMMSLWFRDLLVWQASRSAKLLINYDFRQEIAGQELSQEKIKKALSEIHRAKRRLGQNANKRLCLEVMALSFRTGTDFS